MNREDIIRMAREAGLIHFYDSEDHCTGITDAPLITADSERNDDRLVEMLAPFAALVAAAEREECAKVAYEYPAPDKGGSWRESIAAAIRARAQG
jgi:hypothetical protein